MYFHKCTKGSRAFSLVACWFNLLSSWAKLEGVCICVVAFRSITKLSAHQRLLYSFLFSALLCVTLLSLYKFSLQLQLIVSITLYKHLSTVSPLQIAASVRLINGSEDKSTFKSDTSLNWSTMRCDCGCLFLLKVRLCNWCCPPHLACSDELNSHAWLSTHTTRRMSSVLFS